MKPGDEARQALHNMRWGPHIADMIERQNRVDDAIKIALTTIVKLEGVIEALEPFDLQGAESWAQAIVDEWKRGERDHSACKVAEKLLVILPDLKRSLDALEEQDDDTERD
jgi:hypothetical protein